MGRAFKYVILGGGNSAGYAAHEFVKHGVGAGDVCIISEEAVPPYERPALSKGYLLSEGAVRLPAFHCCVGAGKERQPARWYKDKGVELLLSIRVVSADVKRRMLLTAAGEAITYQTLIVATGARALRLEEVGIPPLADCQSVCYLRDLSDASHLVDTMGDCLGGRAVVIGGGYIGMEAAAALVGNGISVTMIFPEAHCMARLFTPQIAAFYEEVYKKKGITFVKGVEMASFEQTGSGEVSAVVLKDGTRLPCNMVVVGVGIRANTALFEGQLTLEKGGLRVNGQMRTSSKQVYAIGDVTAFPLPLYKGDVRKVEHVDHARRSAAHAVSAILQPDKTGDYDYLPYFYSRVFSLSWQFYGDNVGECVLFGEPRKGKFGAYWVEKGRLMGAFLEGGSQDEYSALAYAARIQPPVQDASALRNSGLTFVLQLAGQAYGRKPPSSADDAKEGDTSAKPLSSNPPSDAPTTATALLHSSSKALAWQASAGVALAIVVVGVAYWHGGKWKKKWTI
eukprot:TRINITY_DN23376_c0_g1_i1.p1 TRINITY_DN23376_c0_g1~~TRINITY_DN23376_c0_g1_i1.p1  ORF type:complete len:509 (-),score=113.78 TRINITY_DN23376_c0_g1_i1:1067-2593(-)